MSTPWCWGGEWKAVKTKPIRDEILPRTDIVILVIGIGLVIIAAVRETMLARGGL